jgi:Predicted transcriptional regulators
MLQLNYRDAKPIYEQVKDGLVSLMVSGGLKEGEKLPSVRAMASSMAINPNTIQRAYESLEQEGYIYSVLGKGSFVATREDISPRRRDELLAVWDKVTGELLFLGVAEGDLKLRLNRMAVQSRNEVSQDEN